MNAIQAHRLHRGKIAISPKVQIEGKLHIWYTPGVAEVSKHIYSNPDDSFELTWRGNTVAVISDGTRVLGLGNIGPEAALPVMEGKALLFKHFGGVDAVPLVLNERDEEKLFHIISSLAPSFGGINLEDIETPKCFHLLDKLRESLPIPVFHDDQQGTATVVLGALINATKLVGKDIYSSKIVLYGAGAANRGLYKLLLAFGVKKENIVVIDSKGVISMERDDVRGTYKEEMIHPSITSLEEAFSGADILVAASKPTPGIISEKYLLKMDNPIIFSLANPTPEVDIETARRVGASVYATGRSDLPNQVNNVLAFPAIFRGILTVRAKSIPDEILIEAARSIASYSERYLPSRIVAPAEDKELYLHESISVAKRAMELGIARRKLSSSELEEEIRRYLGL